MRVGQGNLIKLAVVHHVSSFTFFFLGHNKTIGQGLMQPGANKYPTISCFAAASSPTNLIGFMHLGLASGYRSSLANPNRSVTRSLRC